MKRRTVLASPLIFASLPEIATAQAAARVFRIDWIVATAKALGITVAQTLLLRADEVIR